MFFFFFQTSVTNKNNVERSNSRASLVSSRSSLNSATSTNTIKKMPINTKVSGIQKPSAKTINSKPRPVIVFQHQPKSNVGLKRVPSGSLSTQKPPRPGTAPAFMKPTAASTTKTHAPTVSTRLSSSSFRSVPFK